MNNKKCDQDQILNPTTQRCVKISGSIAKNLIKKHQMGILTLAPDDVKKLDSKNLKVNIDSQPDKFYSIPSTPLEAPLKKTGPELLGDYTIPKQVKQIAREWVKNFRIRKNKNAVAKFCKSLDGNDLFKPIVTMDADVKFPIERALMIESFNPQMLSIELKWKNTLVSGMKLKYNNYNYQKTIAKIVDPSDDIMNIDANIDWEWLVKMNQYIKGLSRYDHWTLLAYTNYGDVIVNNWLRCSLNHNLFTIYLDNINRWHMEYYPLFMPAMKLISQMKGDEFNASIKTTVSSTFKTKIVDFKKKFSKKAAKPNAECYLIFLTIMKYLDFDSFWLRCIEIYDNDLQNIIKNAPPTKNKMVVYRGVQNDYIMNGQKDRAYRTNCYVSTSLNFTAAQKFSGVECCFQRITILPGSRVVLMAGLSKFMTEIEILLGSKTIFYIGKDTEKVPRQYYNELCHDSSTMISVKDLIVLK